MSIYSIFEKLKNNSKKHQPINKIIVGLGNVGPKYENSRHNVGFKALDEISSNFGIKLSKQKFKALIGFGYIGDINCLLMKPLTYMNNSGVSVELARNFYKLDANDIIVLSDDISLDIGKIRIRSKGSAGGHNGLKSIIYSTGSDNFCRIKIGVGAKPSPDYDLAKWVLSDFNQTDTKILNETYKRVASAIKLLVYDKINEAMNEYN